MRKSRGCKRQERIICQRQNAENTNNNKYLIVTIPRQCVSWSLTFYLIVCDDKFPYRQSVINSPMGVHSVSGYCRAKRVMLDATFHSKAHTQSSESLTRTLFYCDIWIPYKFSASNWCDRIPWTTYRCNDTNSLVQSSSISICLDSVEEYWFWESTSKLQSKINWIQLRIPSNANNELR